MNPQSQMSRRPPRLREDDLHVFRREVGGAGAFVVIDGRGETPAVETVFYRPWTHGGFRRRQLEPMAADRFTPIGDLPRRAKDLKAASAEARQ